MPGRTIGGLPIIAWAGALAVGIVGFLWIRKNASGSSTAAAGAASKTPTFTQAQEVQDFQIFSALTGAQQASDLNVVSEVAGLFAGGSSTAASGGVSGGGGGGGSTVPSPPPTGTAPPAVTPLSTAPQASNQAPNPATEPGYGAGLQQLVAANPGILQANSPGGPNIPGITGYTVSYNGVPL